MTETTAVPGLTARAAAAGPVVLLHLGETKTGTTFLQDVMWANRPSLARQGVHLAGLSAQDHHRASRDLRGVKYDENDPRGSWVGEWDLLARQAARADGVTVISSETLAAARPAHAERAMRSFPGAEVHVALTVRDLASVLPAEWQENVKNGGTSAWDEWLAGVLDTGGAQPRGRFWRLHATARTVQTWARLSSPERVHLVTVPPRGAAPDLLWQRWAALLGVDPTSVELSRARANPSLGYAQVEFLRAVNTALGDRVPLWFYEDVVKGHFTADLLGARPGAGRPALDERSAARVAELAATAIDRLRASGAHVVGDLGDLRVATGGPADEAVAAPSDADLSAVGVEAVAQLLIDRFENPAAARKRAAGGGALDRAVTAVAGSPRLKRGIRDLSARFPAVARLRVLAGRLAQRGS